VFSKLHIFISKENEPAECPSGGKHEQERGKNPSYPTTVEFHETKTVFLKASENDAGNQEAGNNEKDIDTNEPTRNQGWKGMERDDRQDCNRAQPINIWPIFRVTQLLIDR